MKRNILLALVAALTISMVAAGVAFAQGNGPGGRGAGTGTSVSMEVTLSNYMPAAMADVFGLGIDDVNASLASGETLQTIALSLGYTVEQLPDLMAAVRAKAIELATAAGVISTDQAAFLLTSQSGGNARGNGTGTASMYSTGTGTGICDGTCVPQSTGTLSGSTGMMRRGGGRR